MWLLLLKIRIIMISRHFVFFYINKTWKIRANNPPSAPAAHNTEVTVITEYNQYISRLSFKSNFQSKWREHELKTLLLVLCCSLWCNIFIIEKNPNISMRGPQRSHDHQVSVCRIQLWLCCPCSGLCLVSQNQKSAFLKVQSPKNQKEP